MTDFLSLPYHQPAFLHLTKIFADEIRYVLIRKFAEFRGKQFLARFPPNQVIESEVAWNLTIEILDSFDNEMRKLVSRPFPFAKTALGRGPRLLKQTLSARV